MSGKKGRSGRATTPEAKRARSDAARKRWGQPPAGTYAPGAPGHGPQELVGELRTIAEHDQHMGRPVTWPDALKRMQLIEQDILNERREVELEEARLKYSVAAGKMAERAELERAVLKVRDAWWREVQSVAGMVLQRLSALSGDDRAAIKSAVDAEVAAAAERVKSSMS